MNAEARPPVLSVSGLSVTFGAGGSRVAVVDRVGFDLAPGEILGLVGESGCGKSMTGAALLGMVPGPGGQVEARKMELEGQDLSALREPGWRKIRGRLVSMVFQEPLTALDPVFSIGSQMSEVLQRHQVTARQESAEVARRMLVAAGILDPDRILRAYPHELSGGMRQRVLIAMAMSCKPRVLVADEPTTALDVTTQAQILQLIRKMARETGTAVLLITHDLGVVAETCDRAMVMYCGRIVEEGPVSRLFARPAHPYTAGLLASLPRLTAGPAEPVSGIPGSVPGLADRPPGCNFNTRCARAADTCRSQAPELRAEPGAPAGPWSGMHRFACHHPLDMTLPDDPPAERRGE